jgi:hypothetical protein
MKAYFIIYYKVVLLLWNEVRLGLEGEPKYYILILQLNLVSWQYKYYFDRGRWINSLLPASSIFTPIREQFRKYWDDPSSGFSSSEKVYSNGISLHLCLRL